MKLFKKYNPTVKGTKEGALYLDLTHPQVIKELTDLIKKCQGKIRIRR